MSAIHYLSKEGEIVGPFTHAEIEALQKSPEYRKYSWRWDHQAKAWAPINAPTSPPRAFLPTEHFAPKEGILALCLEAAREGKILAGALSELSESGCVFVTGESSKALPGFRKGSAVRLNLLEEESGRSENVAAKVLGAKLRDGNWEYQVSWNAMPALLRKDREAGLRRA